MHILIEYDFCQIAPRWLYHVTGLTHLPLDQMTDILADDIFKRIFLNEKFQILIKISV